MERNKNNGFTLIELLVVISIVALLASVAMVALNNSRRNSRDTKRIADIKQISVALELYFEKFGQYPFNGPTNPYEPQYVGYDDVDMSDPPAYWDWDSSCGGGSPADPFLTPLQVEGIISILPDDPSFTSQNNCYRYTSARSLPLPPPKYIRGYYLAAKLENNDNAQNNCDITLSGFFCVMNKH